MVSTVAGSTQGSIDGPTNNSLFYNPSAIAISRDGTLYVADFSNNRIRKIATNGMVSTVVGSTQRFRNGSIFKSLFNNPSGIAISSDGAIYVADQSNHQIRKISTNEIVINKKCNSFLPLQALLTDSEHCDVDIQC